MNLVSTVLATTAQPQPILSQPSLVNGSGSGNGNGNGNGIKHPWYDGYDGHNGNGALVFTFFTEHAQGKEMDGFGYINNLQVTLSSTF